MVPDDDIVSQQEGFSPPVEQANEQDSIDALEFRRARQRGYQANYRQRLKVLRHQDFVQKEIQDLTRRNEEASQQLEAARGRLSRLQNTNSELKQRIQSHVVQKRIIAQSADSGARVERHEDGDSVGEVGKTRPFQQLATSGRHRPSPIWRAAEVDPLKGAPLAAIKVPVSFKDVAACAPQDAISSASDCSFDNAWFPLALEAYLHKAAAKLQCRVQDCLWVLLSPYKLLSGEYLTATGPTDSFCSGLTVTIIHAATVIESLMLEAEHEFLELSIGVQSPGNLQPAPASGSLLQQLRREAEQPATVDSCLAPDPVLVHRLQVLAGVCGRAPLDEAVRCLIRCALHCHRTVLPMDIWKAVCMRVVRWLQRCIQDMQKLAPDAERILAAGLVAAQKGAATGSKGAPANLPISAVPSGHLVAIRAMLLETVTVMKAGPAQGGMSQGEGLVEVRYRMLEILGTTELVHCMMHLNEPRAAFNLVSSLYNNGKKFLVKAERKLVHLISQFNIQDKQAQYAADRWYRWCRRRKSLKRKLATAAAHFSELLPNLEDVQLGLLSAGLHDLYTASADGVAQHRPTPTGVDAWASKSFEESMPSRDSGSEDESVDTDLFVQNMYKSSCSGVESLQQNDHIDENAHATHQVNDSTCAATPGQHAQAQRAGQGRNAQPAGHNGGTHDASNIVPMQVEDAGLDTIKESRAAINTSLPRQAVPTQDMRSSDALLLQLQLVEGASDRYHTLHTAAPSEDPTFEDASRVWELQPRGKTKCLLGECGAAMRDIENAVMSLISHSHSDYLLIRESTCFMMGLTPLQHSRKSSEYMRGAPKFDILKLQEVAAHEQRWKDIFAPFRIFEDPVRASGFGFQS